MAVTRMLDSSYALLLIQGVRAKFDTWPLGLNLRVELTYRND